MMSETIRAADLSSLVGQEQEPSSWLEITQARVNEFAKATNDHQFIHVDPEKASKTPFAGPIAHGYLTLSLAPVLLGEVVTVSGCETVINTGLEKLRLSAPVLAGSRVRMSAKLSGARDLPGGAVRATFRIRMEVEGSAKPACHGYVTYVYHPR